MLSHAHTSKSGSAALDHDTTRPSGSTGLGFPQQMKYTSSVVDRQIDEAVGLKRWESHETRGFSKLIRLIRQVVMSIMMSV